MRKHNLHCHCPAGLKRAERQKKSETKSEHREGPRAKGARGGVPERFCIGCGACDSSSAIIKGTRARRERERWNKEAKNKKSKETSHRVPEREDSSWFVWFIKRGGVSRGRNGISAVPFPLLARRRTSPRLADAFRASKIARSRDRRFVRSSLRKLRARSHEN